MFVVLDGDGDGDTLQPKNAEGLTCSSLATPLNTPVATLTSLAHHPQHQQMYPTGSPHKNM